MLKRKIISGIILLGISGISYAQYANIEELNSNASCDSTCSIDPDKVKVLSGQNQRLSNCGYGYIGSNLEDRVVNQDGSWSDWREVNRDNCACSPLTENQEVECPTNQRGQHIQTRDWTCPSVAQGEYTSWVTKSNTCDYYYLSTATEEQTIACPDNQRGTHIQTRNYENWSDSSKRSYTVWSTKSNTCDYYLTAASQIETSTVACPAGQTGSITKTRTYDRWSDGSARNYGGWIEVARNCVSSIPQILAAECGVFSTYTTYTVINGVSFYTPSDHRVSGNNYALTLAAFATSFTTVSGGPDRGGPIKDWYAANQQYKDWCFKNPPFFADGNLISAGNNNSLNAPVLNINSYRFEGTYLVPYTYTIYKSSIVR